MIFDVKGIIVESTLENAKKFSNVLHPHVQFEKFNHLKTISQATASYDSTKYQFCFISDEFPLDEVAKIFGSVDKFKRSVFFIRVVDALDISAANDLKAGFDSVIMRVPDEKEKEQLALKMEKFRSDPKYRERSGAIQEFIKSIAPKPKLDGAAQAPSEAIAERIRRTVAFNEQEFESNPERVAAASERVRALLEKRGVKISEPDSIPAPSPSSDPNVEPIDPSTLNIPGFDPEELEGLSQDELQQLAAFSQDPVEEEEPEPIDPSTLNVPGFAPEELEGLSQDELQQLAGFSMDLDGEEEPEPIDPSTLSIPGFSPEELAELPQEELRQLAAFSEGESE